MTDKTKIKRLIQKDQYDLEQEIYDDLLLTINKYSNQTSVISVLGILDLIKDELKLQAKNR